MPDLAAVRTDLLADRDKLIARLNELGVDVEGAAKDFADDEGFADSGSVTAEKGELMTLAESLRESLDEVEAALERIEDGTYGKCIRCGENIPDVRLDILPAAPYCLDCAAIEEP